MAKVQAYIDKSAVQHDNKERRVEKANPPHFFSLVFRVLLPFPIDFPLVI